MVMRHKKRKKRYRGGRTHGRGAAKHGRGKGTKRGRGSAKSGKRNYLYILKYEKERLPEARKGFFTFKVRQKSINLKDLQRLSQEKEIDVTKFGYTKVIGGGELEKSMTIKAFFFSKPAKDKIEKAGGKAVVLGETGE